MKKISVFELKKKLEEGERLQIVDIREQAEYNVCHIPGALCLPKKDIFDHLNQIAREMPVIMYCRYGAKTPPVVITLENDHGIRNILSLEDGIYAWAKEIDRWMLDLI